MKKLNPSYQGGGAKTSLTNKKTTSVFKPLIASSLALALGASVAVATDPTYQYNGSTDVDYKNPGIWENRPNPDKPTETIAVNTGKTTVSWDNARDYLVLKTADSTTIRNFEIGFGDKSAELWGNGLTTFIPKSSLKSVTFTNDGNNKGIKLGDSGDGTFKVQLADHFTKMPTITLNFLGKTTDGQESVALYGNFEVSGGVKKPSTGTGVGDGVVATFGGSIKGDVSINGYYGFTGKVALTFNQGGITGNVSNVGGLEINFEENATIGGNINTSIVGLAETDGGKTTITFENGGTIGGSITANAGSNAVYFNDGAGIFNGSISIANSGNAGANNSLVFNGTTSQFGTSARKSNIAVNFSLADGGATFGAIGNNTIIANASTSNTFTLGNITLNGNYALNGNNAEKKTFNILSFNQGTTTLTADSITASYGINIIGKNVATESSKTITYDTSLFDTTSGLIGKANFATTFMTDTYKATGTYTIGSGSGNAIVSSGGGNYINVENLAVNGNVAANGGENVIIMGTGSLTGNISASSGTNTITAGNFSITGNITSSGGSNTITASAWGNNTSGGVIATGSGINNITATSGNVTFAGISTKDYNASSSGNTINFGSGSITINARSGDSDSGINGKALYAKNGSNNNTITAGTILVNGEIYANSDATNSLTASSSITVTGNIGGGATNNFTLTADNASLTLKGENSTITTLTALVSATTGNTLTLDATNNANVVASIGTLTNGGSLNVDFKGINGTKSTQLTLDTTTASNRSLKSVSVASGLNNTLTIAGTNTMTIGSASVGEASGNKEGVIFDLSSGSSLTFTSGLTIGATGSATFEFGGTSNTLVGTITNSGTNTFNLNATTTTIKSGAEGLQFNGGTNNINFNKDGITLNWQNTSNTSKNIKTLNGITNINFYGNATVGTGIETSGGTTNITIAKGKDVAINSTVSTSGSGATNITFAGGTTRTPDYSTLTLGAGGNTITSLTSSANAKLALSGTNGATINTVTINDGGSLLFAFSGSGASTVTATNGITVGDGATLGISLSGDGEKKLVANGSAKIEFAKGSTLLIDFQANNQANGTIGDGKALTITEGSNSIVNFHGTNSGSLNAQNGNSVMIDGGNNTVNFYGSATFGGIGFGAKGGTNTINVVDGATGHGITGTVAVADISKSNVKNIINLGDNATLALTNTSTTLTSSSTGNELNFIGDNAKFQGGFEVTGNGSAIIKVGSADYANKTVAGIITGAVTGADLEFNAKESTLTLQGQTNTFTSLTSGASDGILYLDASTSNVSAEIGSSFAIDSGKSLTFALVSGGNTAGATTNGGEASVSVTGAITVGTGGTLGIAIGGNNKNGQRSVTASGGITFQGGSTLRVDFLANSEGTASLGTGKDGFVITDGNKSVINFYAGSSATLDGGLTIDGGDNTVNFQGSAQLRDIKLVRGTNTINVLGASAEGSRITATLISENLGGNKFSNTVNLEKFAVLNLKADKSSGDGSGSIKALVNVNDESTVIQGNLLDGSSIAFTKKAGGLTLKSAISSGVTNELTTISTVDGASNTLTLDTTGGDNTTTVSEALNASGLSVNLAGTDTTHKATLALNGGSLGAINVANSANTLALNGRETSINTFALASNAVLNIEFNGGGLNAVNGIAKDADKTFNLSVNKGNSYVSGGAINANALSFEDNTSLAIRNNEASFATVSGNGTLVLDGSNGATIAGKPSVKVTLAEVTGGNLTAKFNGSEAKGAELVMSKTEQTLDAIAFGTNSTNNKLTLATGKTIITNGVSVGNGNAITFSLADGTTLNLAGGMTSAGTSIISVASSGSANSATLSGGNINVSNVSLSGNNASTLTLTATSTDIATLTTSATTSNTLIVDGAGSTNGASATLRTINGVLDVVLKGANTKVATLNLNGGTINSVSATAGDATQNIINFESGTTIITNAINSPKVASGQGLALNINGGRLILEDVISTDGGGTINVTNNAVLQLKGVTNQISSLSGNGVVDLAVADFNGNTVTRSVRARAFKTLTIADYSGNHTFNLYVDPKAQGSTKADQVIVTDQNPSGSATFTVTGNIDDILGITYEKGGSNNVQIASGMGTKTTGVSVFGGDSLIGYDIIQAQVIKEDDGKVYLGQAISKGVAQEIKDVASSALTVNYDLFLANFNSLNKRMGELRDNANSQGVWTRVFGGAMSNDFGAGSKSEYVTAQAGYDYSLTLGDARNYMGIAVAYGHSTTKSNALNIQASQGATIALQDVKSNMVEVGIYNSYVMDSGWYNDTIFKFDYIMSSFTMTDNLSLESETNNFAMVLSDEFGYRYKFAESEKGNWYIDPQVEVAFGYFNQSDFNRATVATNSTLEATQDNILTLRTRAGLSLGKKFNTAKGFASLYVGAFYEYDYINGGDAEVLSKSGIANPLDKLESNGRAIVNVGSNIELTEGVRMYIDVEKSFGDKQRTDMQFNFGARYSFGEKTPTISYQEAQKKRVAPLKVEDKQEANTQESKTEAPANTEMKQ